MKVQLTAMIRKSETTTECSSLNFPTPSQYFTEESLLGISDNWHEVASAGGKSLPSFIKANILTPVEQLMAQDSLITSVSVRVTTERMITTIKVRKGSGGIAKVAVNNKVRNVRANLSFVSDLGNLTMVCIGERFIKQRA